VESTEAGEEVGRGGKDEPAKNIEEEGLTRDWARGEKTEGWQEFVLSDRFRGEKGGQNGGGAEVQAKKNGGGVDGDEQRCRNYAKEGRRCRVSKETRNCGV